MAEKSTLARPYAKAIYALAKETGLVEKWSDQLQVLARLSEHELIADMIINPAIDHEVIVDIFEEVGKDVLNEQGRNLIQLASHNNRLNLFREISNAFEKTRASEQGVVEVEITSAYSVNAAQKKAIKDALTKRFNKDVKISTSIDKSLVAGIIIRAGDLVIDGSVNHQLEKISKSLMR